MESEMYSEFGSCVSLISCCQIHLGENEVSEGGRRTAKKGRKGRRERRKEESEIVRKRGKE